MVNEPNEPKQCACSQKCIEKLLTQYDVSIILGVSVKTLECWRSKGRGPRFVKVGKLARYRKCDLKEYIEALVN